MSAAEEAAALADAIRRMRAERGDTADAPSEPALDPGDAVGGAVRDRVPEALRALADALTLGAEGLTALAAALEGGPDRKARQAPQGRPGDTGEPGDTVPEAPRPPRGRSTGAATTPEDSTPDEREERP